MIRIKKARHNQGSSLVEAMISVAILAYVIVSILSGISQQKLSSQNTADKNAAVMLAEQRIEELLKFPTDQLAVETYVDYITVTTSGFNVTTSDPVQKKQFRRTTTITKDGTEQVATIHVLVQYGAQFNSVTSSGQLIYPFQIELATRRALR
ncbi:MAG: type IV pilus modification PilV family protein [Candidatus Omnitrophota bacterium]